MQNKYLLIVFAALYAAMFSVQPAKAKIWRVNNQGFSADTTVLQAAIDLASPNDTIHVEASGTAYLPVTIGKPLVLLGPGYFLNMNSGLQNNSTPATVISIAFDPGSAGSVLSGISVDQGTTSSKVFINESNLTIERCYIWAGIQFQNLVPNTLNNIIIKQCYDHGGLYNNGNGSGPINNLVISNCYFGDNFNIATGALNTYQGIVTQCVINNTIFGWSSAVTYRNNIITGIFNQNGVNSIGNVQYNLFVAGSVPAWLSGGTNVFQANNVFIAPTSSTDHNLTQNTSANCPVCYQGFPSGTGTIGMFGGTDSYILSGIPNIPAIYNLQAPLNTYPGGVVNTNISTRSNN